jgi:type II secretory pathway component PulF
MPEFSYLVRDEAGKMQRGHLSADSAAALRSLLEAQGERLISAKPVESPSQRIGWTNPLHRLPPR